jgi:hypothetical protein
MVGLLMLARNRAFPIKVAVRPMMIPSVRRGGMVHAGVAMLRPREHAHASVSMAPGGIRLFLLRGLEKMRGEWSLIYRTHNLRKLFAKGFQVITQTVKGAAARVAGAC